VKAGGGHVEYWQIVYYAVRVTMFMFAFQCKYDASLFCKHFMNVRNDYIVTLKFNNFPVVKGNEMPLLGFLRALCIITNNSMKLHVKFPSSYLENGKN